MQSDPYCVLPIAIGGNISEHTQKSFPIDDTLRNGCLRRTCEWLYLRGCCVHAYHVDSLLD